MKRWRARSIGTRLVAAHLASLCAVLLIFAAGVYWLFSRSLDEALQRELGREFEIVEGSLWVSPSGAVHLRGDDDPEEAHYEGERIAAEVFSPSGQLLVRSRAAAQLLGSRGSASPSSAPSLPSLSASSVEHVEGFATIEVAGQPLRVLRGSHSVGGREFLIRVFHPMGPMREATGTLAWSLLLVLVLALVFAAAISRRVVNRLFLQPLGRMIARARGIGVAGAGKRLPITNPNDELGQLARVINDAFARFDEAVLRLRRFTADASHELRTPLSSIRSVGEARLRAEASPAEYRDTIGSMLEEVEALTRMLDSLLLLSKADEEQVQLCLRRQPLVELVQQVQEVLSVLAEPNDQSIAVHGDPGLEWAVDGAVLKMALMNLLDNAIKHAPHGSVIEASVASDAEGARIDIHNGGEAIAAEHRQRIFDRFYRVDAGRSRSAGGSGLGLSVTRWAVQMHGGSVSVVDDGRDGTTFRIRLPGGSEAQR